MQLYLLKDQYLQQNSYLAIIWLQKQPYLLGAIDITENNISYIYLYSQKLTQPISYYLIVIYHLMHNSSITLSVLSLNSQAVSLYLWLNYQIFCQRKVYEGTSSKHSISLVHINVVTKNFVKRYLIFRYLEH